MIYLYSALYEDLDLLIFIVAYTNTINTKNVYPSPPNPTLVNKIITDIYLNLQRLNKSHHLITIPDHI